MPVAAEFRHLYRTPEYYEARDSTRARANGRCEWCGKPNHTTVEVARDGSGRWSFSGMLWYGADGLPCPRYRGPAHPVYIVLTTAHLDHDPTNNDFETNLAALCQRCHLVYDGPHHRQSKRLHRDAATGQLRLDLPELRRA